MKKRIIAFCFALLFAVVLALPAGAVPGYAPPEGEVSAEAVYLVNLDTNLVVYERNSETPMEAASVTKLMTCLLMLKEYQDQLDTVSVTAPGSIYDILYGTNSSTADIRRGEVVTLRDLLYAMMLPSGNEAAYIVADYMGGGSWQSFVDRMNSEAAALGCTGTTFVDPCGLDYGNLTTARDIYLMLRAVIEYDAFVEAIAATEYELGANTQHTKPYTIRNTNRMIVRTSPYYRGYTLGGKTGSLSNWMNFAGWHSKNGVSYISVVMHSVKTEEESRPALKATGELMDWAFDTFSIAPALDVTTPIYELDVAYSTDTDTILLYPADDMMTLLPAEGGAALTTRTFQLPQRLVAPIEQGDVVGTVTLSIEDQVIGTVDLIAGRSASRSNILFTIARLQEFFGGRYFRIVVVVTLVVVAVYAMAWVAAMAIAANREDKKDPRAQNRRR